MLGSAKISPLLFLHSPLLPLPFFHPLLTITNMQRVYKTLERTREYDESSHKPGAAVLRMHPMQRASRIRMPWRTHKEEDNACDSVSFLDAQLQVSYRTNATSSPLPERGYPKLCNNACTHASVFYAMKVCFIRKALRLSSFNTYR